MLSLLLGSAPASSNFAMTAGLASYLAAILSGVQSFLVRLFTSAPASSNFAMTAGLASYLAAILSGVQSFLVRVYLASSSSLWLFLDRRISTCFKQFPYNCRPSIILDRRMKRRPVVFSSAVYLSTCFKQFRYDCRTSIILDRHQHLLPQHLLQAISL